MICLVLAPSGCREPCALAVPCAGDNWGPASRPCVGSVGLGVWGCRPPMSTVVQPVPHVIGAATRYFRLSAIGIVSRFSERAPLAGLDRRPEPGSRIAANRPALFAASDACACAAFLAAAAAATCGHAGGAAAAARIHTPPSNTGVNKVSGVGHGDN